MLQFSTHPCHAATHVSLASKLTLALSAVALVVFASVGAWQLDAESRDLRAALERDVRLLGRSLEVAFENALRDRQGEDVEETLRELERIDPVVDIFVYAENGALLAASTGAVERARFAAGGTAPGLRYDPPQDPREIELAMPLQISRGRPPATLVVVRPLDEMRRDLRATRIRIATSVAAFAAVLAVLTMVLARYWVSRPLARMVVRMRRVKAGDLENDPAERTNDEVGHTLDEFDALVTELREARERLQSEADRRLRLEEGLRDLDKLATVGQLAAGLAHEIGSPLQILEGRLASLEHKADDPSETRRLARISLEHARRITRIVSQLTSLAKRRAPRADELDAAASVRLVVELLEGEARRRGVTLSLRAPSDRLPTVGDGDHLQQLALNLLRNALEATPSGGQVEVSIEPMEFMDPGGSAHSGIRLVVRDTGRGMDAETLDRAFEPFFTTRVREGGTGLGLAVVKGLADAQGGRVEVDSSPGRGTQFRIELPAARRAMSGEESASDA